MDDSDLREVQAAAAMHGMTVAEWVRQTLRSARRQEPIQKMDAKLSVVRAAASLIFPAPEMPQMLEEIEQGYLWEDLK
jgi:hypothetical protein